MPRQTKEDRATDYARIAEIDKLAIALMGERGCSLSQAWRMVLDGWRPKDAVEHQTVRTALPGW